MTPAERRAAVARTLGPLPADVANCNVVQDARWRRIDAHLSGVASVIARADADEAGWIAEVRRQKAEEDARRAEVRAQFAWEAARG